MPARNYQRTQLGIQKTDAPTKLPAAGDVALRVNTAGDVLVTSPDGSEATLGGPGGGAPTLSEVLTAGRSAAGGAITNLADPSGAQDAATKAWVLANFLEHD